MEYFIGSAVAFIIVYVMSSVLRKNQKKLSSVVIRYNQSSVFELIKPFVVSQIEIIPFKMTQAMKDVEENTLRILHLEGKAYWIEKNQLLEANAPDGEIDKESIIEVDTMGMDELQLKRTMYIVEKLREGFRNDFGYPGNTQF